MLNLSELALSIVRHYKQSGFRYSEIPGHKNLVYIEGATYFAGQVTKNFDRPDEWNDLRVVFEFTQNGVPFISLMAKATCEPGTSATNSLEARRNGGVARLQLIQYLEAAKMGYHKEYTRTATKDQKTGKSIWGVKVDRSHPALVQVGKILVFRDANRDQKRTGDPIHPALGINHHSTKKGFKSSRVGNFSAGCGVGWNWEQHLEFIELMKKDPRYIADNNFAWDFALCDIVKLQNMLI